MSKQQLDEPEKGKVGDELVVDAPHIGDVVRKGEILEVLDTGDVRHYRIRWDDGHESIYFPGWDAKVLHLHEPQA